jgi:ribosomal protein S18 acetylase RimI-like enzyme
MVGQVVVNPWRGIAGIYDMGVVPSHQRQGIGRALTLAACRLGRELGCTHAVLNATGEGEPLYRAVGFESLGMGQTWWLHPGSCP